MVKAGRAGSWTCFHAELVAKPAPAADPER
jgi:hypothetical protein